MKEKQTLRVSRFDAVTSGLMTVMIFAGSVTATLALLWWVSRFESPQKDFNVPTPQVAIGGFSAVEDLQQEFEQPGSQEFQSLNEPSLADSVAAVTTAASRISGSFSSRLSKSGITSNSGTSIHSRMPGPNTAASVVPRSQRWQLNFSAKNQTNYAKQLDFFYIELGAVGGDILGLDIVNNLAGSPTSRRVEDASTEKRLYFIFKRPSPLMNYERSIHNQAGVDLQGRNMFKLIPQQLENLLAKIELDYATSKGHPSITEVAKTVFESKPGGAGYEFEVIAQRYRNNR